MPLKLQRVLLPSVERIVESPFRPEEILGRLAKAIRPPRGFSCRQSLTELLEHEPIYEGTVRSDRFEVTESASSRRMLPLVTGTVFGRADGTQLRFNMRMREGTQSFLVLWYGLAGVIALHVLGSEGPGSRAFGALLLFALSGIVIFQITFRHESDRTVRDLVEIAGGKARLDRARSAFNLW